MQVQKLRVPHDGLVPAGHYFERLSRALRDTNARESAAREHVDLEDRALEANYRRCSASRANVYVAH
jgi:hypothetical protein